MAFPVCESLQELLALPAPAGGADTAARIPLDLLADAESHGFAHDGIAFCADGETEKHVTVRKSHVFDGCDWLTFGGNTEAVIAAATFEAKAGVPARLVISGLGFCELYLNGKPVSDRLLAPAWTNYVGRDTSVMNYPIHDVMTARILYENLDVTPLLRDGANTLVVHLGGGWFCQHESRNEGVVPYGALTLCCKLTQGGTDVLRSSPSFRWRPSFVTRSNIYFGERHDPRELGFDFSDAAPALTGWRSADRAAAPVSVLSEQDCPADRVIRIVHPTCIFKRGDYRVYDLGEALSGVPVFVKNDDTEHDEVITYRFADALADDGGLLFAPSGWSGRVQRGEFIVSGDCEREMYPRFTWHSGRYFDVTGEADVKEFRVVHTDLRQTVRFHSSDEILQWIVDAYLRTQLNNVHTCVPSDCPHRERLGYTGDGWLCTRAALTCFDAAALYRKWMRDIADSQDLLNGHVQHTAPFYGGGGGPGGWGGAIVFVPYAYWKMTGDLPTAAAYYPHMLAYLDYLESRSEDGLVVREEEGGWCLGDWCSPGNKNLIPPEFVNTYFRIKALDETAEIAAAIGKPTDALNAERARVTERLLAHFYDPATGTFCGSVEAADAYGFDLGLGDGRTFDAIVAKYTALGEFDTGIFGTEILIRVLCENGQKELARALLTSRKENTYYNMKKHGATTLWENWDGVASHDHPMFGAVVEHIVKYFNEA